MDERHRNGNGSDVEPILVPVPIETRRREPIKPPRVPTSMSERELRATLADLIMQIVPAFNALSNDTADIAAQNLALSVAFNRLSGNVQAFFRELRETSKTAIREAVSEAREELEEAVEEATNPGVVEKVVDNKLTAHDLGKAEAREKRIWQLLCLVLGVVLAWALAKK